MSVPALSIITVTYKDPSGLERTLRSLAELREKISFEHIIVDSSPTENGGVLQNLGPWPLVHLTEEPKGIYAAMNKGILAAKGQLLWFLNGGDELKSVASLHKVLERLLRADGPALVLAGADLFRNGVYLYSVKPQDSLLNALIGEHRQCHQAVLYNRKHFLSVAHAYSPKYRLAADYHLHWLFFLAGKQCEILPESLVKYDMGGSSSKYKAVFQEYRKIHQEISSQLPLNLRWKNASGLQWNYGKMLFIKAIAGSFLGEKLRPAWLWFQRR